MKKKLLVLLLTSSMILMNFAPAYGAGDFTDSDNVTAVENPGSSDVDAIPDMGNAVNDEMSLLRNRQMMISFRMKRKCLLSRREIRWSKMLVRE